MLKYAVELREDLVDCATRTHLLPAIIGLRCKVIAEPFNMLGGDRRGSLWSKRGNQMGIQHRAIVASSRRRPITLIAAVRIPIRGNLLERQAGALLAHLAAARFDKDLGEQRLGPLLAQEP